MIKIKNLVLSIIITITAHGCMVTYGDYNTSNFTSLSQGNYNERSESMYLFYQGEPIDFNYEKIGEVEAEGEEYANNKDIINHLANEAWENGANGLINIKSGYKDREQGRLFDSDSEEIYSSKYYTALAVKIRTDSLFLEKHGSGMDTASFVNEVEAYNFNKGEKTVNQTVGSILVGLVGTIAAIIIANNK